jgi:hypothetical protein
MPLEGVFLFLLIISLLLIKKKQCVPYGRLFDGECNWQPPLKTYKRRGKTGSSAQALIWDVSDDGELSLDFA